MAASALFHIDCPELIAHSLVEYKQIIKLIESRELRLELRTKIQKNTESKALFNTKNYTSIWERPLKPCTLDGKKENNPKIWRSNDNGN